MIRKGPQETKRREMEKRETRRQGKKKREGEGRE
jgi:hypothetical protein